MYRRTGVRTMNAFLRGFRVQSASAVWDRGQAARAASSRVPVLLCTPSVALADAFDIEDVLRLG
ncbi:hypothetical protein ASNO1_38840 [Corallococcus caeni]|uniref:Uncharacterized protein n=2 Tax=Corallococcus caeni TaxID=3082388 RepID=A0ABQ6QUF6_9BACT|nr:hypothetical protein ASNO1_38840 [Corallococcus sp. NO1]